MERAELLKAISKENSDSSKTLLLSTLVEFSNAKAKGVCIWSKEAKRAYLNAPMLKVATGRVYMHDGWAYYSKDNRVSMYTEDKYWTIVTFEENSIPKNLTVTLDRSDRVINYNIVSDGATFTYVETNSEGKVVIDVDSAKGVNGIRIYGQCTGLELSGKTLTDRPGVLNPLVSYIVENVTDEHQGEIDSDSYFKSPLVIRTQPML